MTYAFGLKIEGVEIPPPSGYSFVEADLVVNSQRNASGYVSFDVVRENVGSIDLTWDKLDGERMQQIVNAIRGKKTFNATFFNPNTGQMETRKFYAGDRSNELARFISTQKYWSSLSVPFVEV